MYIYETHLHTNQSSACGESSGRDYVKRYIDLGYSGIMVTDHFFGGNTAIPRRGPWKERIHAFCRGYEDALEEGLRRGFSVFFGWEENMDGDEYLVYGLDKAWLLEHPEMERWTRKEQFDAVTAAGGCVVQAHPFRDRAYISAIHLSTGCVHAIEGYNGGNSPHCDAWALRYGQKKGFPITAGTDIHHIHQRKDEELMGVVFDKPLATVSDYVQAIRQGLPFGVKAPAGRGAWEGDLRLGCPVDIRDENDKSTGLAIEVYLGL